MLLPAPACRGSWWDRPDLNRDCRFRKPVLYPFKQRPRKMILARFHWPDFACIKRSFRTIGRKTQQESEGIQWSFGGRGEKRSGTATVKQCDTMRPRRMEANASACHSGGNHEQQVKVDRDCDRSGDSDSVRSAIFDPR